MRFEEEEKRARHVAMDDIAEAPTSRGMGAYLEAMKGEDGHVTDAKGRVKFNKTQGKRGRGDFDEDEDGDVPVTAGLRELEVGRKKVKKDKVAIGGEFKAKVSRADSAISLHRTRFDLVFSVARRRRRREEWRAAVRVRAARQRCWQKEQERQGSENGHHGFEKVGQDEGRVRCSGDDSVICRRICRSAAVDVPVCFGLAT